MARSRRQQLLLRWVAVSLLVVVILGYLGLKVANREDSRGTTADTDVTGLTSVLSREIDAEMVSFQFAEVRGETGIDFLHFPARRQSLLPEDMGSGLAWGDYDNDGDPDLFLVNFAGAVSAPDADPAASGRPALYRNEGAGRFLDVTDAAGLDDKGFGMGAAWGDYDNDDDLDLYITHYGANRLYRNNGDGSFSDVTEAAGVGDESFSAGSAWGDFDNDGWIDLYVTNYVDFRMESANSSATTRQYGTEIPYTLNPSSYAAVANRLYRNNQDGSFSNVAESAGVANAEGRSLGAAWFDFDNDGLIDLYVANDVSSNGVFRNLGNGRFDDIGASSLAADYRGAMGLAVGDYESDGDQDLFVTHWLAQENAFFENMISEELRDEQGRVKLLFGDSAEVLGLGQISLKTVGWATGMADMDNDGYLDLWVVNGDTLEQSQDTSQLRPQRMQLFRQKPGAGFFEIGQQASPVLAQRIVGRGGAHADYDGDGRLDIAVQVHGAQPLILHNRTPNDQHWLGIRLRQEGRNTRAIGAQVKLHTGDRSQSAQVGTQGSYLSQHQDDLHFGLGSAGNVDKLTIRWPDGYLEEHLNVTADQVVEFRHVARYGHLK